MRRLLHFALALALAAPWAAPIHAFGQVASPLTRGAKRLILKDGGYQLATKWEVKGERVRYYSAERSMWEEIPSALIDWKATEAWNSRKKDEGLVSPEVVEAIEEDEAARREDRARTPEVAPGLALPATGGVFLLDRLKGADQLVEVVQSGTDIKRNTALNAIKAAINPLALSVKQSIELPGMNAAIQSHTAQPQLFINLEPQGIFVPAEGQAEPEKENPVAVADRYKIIRARLKGEKRVVGNLKIGITGRMSEQRDMVPAAVESMGGGWVRVKPLGTLEPGEYALVELLGENKMNLYVWDFGVNPTAPPNPSAWHATQPESTKTGTNQSPALTPRPK